MDDALRLTLRRRVPLPDVAPDAGPLPVTIGGETRRLSPLAIDILRWLFCHDPATLRSLRAELTAHHGPDTIEVAINQLLRFGFLLINRGG
jgi:hypothetical protein